MDDTLIVQIVLRVLARLNLGPFKVSAKSVLVIFSGASSGYLAGEEAITWLSQAGHRVTSVLTPSAEAMLGAERSRKAGAHVIIDPHTWADSPGLVRAADLVLLPTLSMNLAAHLALGMLDSLVTTLVIGARLAGKPVVAIRDGADLDGPAGMIFGTGQAAPALRAHIQGHLTALASYGIELVSEKDFQMTVERHVSGQARQVASGMTVLAVPHLSGVITQADLAPYQTGTTVHLAAGSRVTALAREMAHRLGIKLVFD